MGTAIAFGDLNGDLWPDLVVGNSGEPCVKVFLAHAARSPARRPAPPRAASFVGNHPNPFNPATTLLVDLPRAANLTLRIHDAAGRLVRTLARGEGRAAGRHEITWDGRDRGGRAVPAGVYVARLAAGSDRDSARLVLVK